MSSLVVGFFRGWDYWFKEVFLKWGLYWRKEKKKEEKNYRLWGSNPRKVSLADLKSAPFDHSGKPVNSKSQITKILDNTKEIHILASFS